MAKNLRTKRALIDSGAYTEAELSDDQPVGILASPTRGIGRQVSQSEYDAKLARDKARADANRRAAKDAETRRRLRGF
jgi:hypothetical protein